MKGVILEKKNNLYYVKPRDKKSHFIYGDFIFGLVNLLSRNYIIIAQDLKGEYEVIDYDLNHKEIDLNSVRQAYDVDKVYLSDITFEEYIDLCKLDFEKLFVFESCTYSFLESIENKCCAKFLIHPDGLNQMHCYIKKEAIFEILIKHIDKYNNIT